MLSLVMLFIFSIPEKFDCRYTSIYNRLPEVEASSAEIENRLDFNEFLENFQKLVFQYKLQDCIGLRLIHRHFDFDLPLPVSDKHEQMVMSEEFEMIDGIKSLVTHPVHIRSLQPASWLFFEGEEEGIPFEFSSDPAVEASRCKIDQASNFFLMARDMIVKRKFEHLLSLSILKRDVLPIDISEVYLENNCNTQGRSIVQIVDRKSEHLKRALRTSWGFSSEGYCQSSSYCQTNWDVNSKPWHSTAYKHEYLSTS